MKVVHVCTNYNGGAGKAAFRLHNALLKKGIDSAFVSLGERPLIDVNCNKSVLIKRNPSLFIKIIRKVKKKLGLEHQFILYLRKLSPKLDYLTLSLPISELNIDAIEEIKNADIINLHGVAHVLDYNAFFKKTNKQIVWTLHDINPISGIFHIRADEEKNKIEAQEFNKKVLDFKLKAYENITGGAIVSPSYWLYDEALKRKVFQNFEHYEVSNSIPPIYFESKDRICLKERYKIPSDVVTLLFISSNLNDKNKGFDLLLTALKFLENENIHLLIVGGGNSSVFDAYKNTSFGYISNDNDMIDIYNLADVFVIPSRDENLPNVLLESLACGTPVVSFKVGGMVQYIQEGVNGELANKLDGQSLGEAILKVIDNKSSYSREIIKSDSFLKFNEKKQADAYIEIYKSLLCV